MVEVAEGLAAEGGRAAAVLVGEEVVADGARYGWHRGTPLMFGRGGLGKGRSRFRVKNENPAGAGLWVNLGLLQL
jgi:hypothetical protein